jgi:hypothetical protein
MLTPEPPAPGYLQDRYSDAPLTRAEIAQLDRLYMARRQNNAGVKPSLKITYDMARAVTLTGQYHPAPSVYRRVLAAA